ncbi:MAG: hypothetical protein PHD67_08580 [Oscillospiraceae bacterium]|nr:hypothetical protein [Oscillospiraceae bacterium]
MFWGAAAAVIAAGLACCSAMRRCDEAQRRFAFCGGEDSDIKIAPEFPSRQPKTDAGEAAAQEFADQKEKGNVEKAYLLATRLAGYLLSSSGEVACAVQKSEDPQVVLNRQILFAFAVTSSLEASPTSELITQTAENFFYDSLKTAAPELYEKIILPEAFSLYLLYSRDSGEGGAGLGEPFAKLCGREGDAELTALGNSLYEFFQKVCLEKIAEVRFQ